MDLIDKYIAEAPEGTLEGKTKDEVAQHIYDTYVPKMEEAGEVLSRDKFYKDVLKYESPGFGEELKQGLARHGKSMKVLATDGMAATVNSLLGREDAAIESATQATLRLQEIQKEHPRSVLTHKDIKNKGDLGQWLGATMGEGIGSTVDVLGSALLGGGVGGAVKIGGTALAKGAIKKTLLKQGITDITEEAIEASMKKGMVNKILKAPLAKIGAGVGAYQKSARTETGSVYLDILNAGEDAPGISLMAGALIGGVEMLPEFAAVNRLFKGTLSKAAQEAAKAATVREILIQAGVKTIPKEILKTSLGEGITEAAQQEIQNIAKDIALQTVTPLKGERLDSIIESGLAGLFGGMPMGVFSGGAQTLVNLASKQAESSLGGVLGEDPSPLTPEEEALYTSLISQSPASQGKGKKAPTATQIKEKYDLDEEAISAFTAEVQQEEVARAQKMDADIAKAVATTTRLEETPLTQPATTLTLRDQFLKERDLVVAEQKANPLPPSEFLAKLSNFSPRMKADIVRETYPDLAQAQEVGLDQEQSLAPPGEAVDKTEQSIGESKLDQEISSVAPRQERTLPVPGDKVFLRGTNKEIKVREIDPKDGTILKADTVGKKGPKGFTVEPLDYETQAERQQRAIKSSALRPAVSRTPVFKPTDQWDGAYQDLRYNFSKMNFFEGPGAELYAGITNAVEQVAGKGFRTVMASHLQLFENPTEATHSQTLRGAQVANLIFLALDYNKNLGLSNFETAYHEAFHAIYPNLSPQEQRVFENNRKDLEDYAVRHSDLLRADVELASTEELAATAFGHYALSHISPKPTPTPKGPVGRLFEKMVNILKSMNRALRRLNITKPEDIFNNALEGRYAINNIKDILDQERVLRAQQSISDFKSKRLTKLLNAAERDNDITTPARAVELYSGLPQAQMMDNIQAGIIRAFNTAPGLAGKDPYFALIHNITAQQERFLNIKDAEIEELLHDIISQPSKQRLNEASNILAHLDMIGQTFVKDPSTGQLIYKDREGKIRRASVQASLDVAKMTEAFRLNLKNWARIIQEKITSADGFASVAEAKAHFKLIAEDSHKPETVRLSARKRLKDIEGAESNLKEIQKLLKENKPYFPRNSMGKFGIKLVSRENPKTPVKYGFAMLDGDMLGKPSKKEFENTIRRWKEELGYTEKDYVFPTFEKGVFALTSDQGKRALRKSGLYDSMDILLSALAPKTDPKLMADLQRTMFETVQGVSKLKMNASFIKRQDTLLPSQDYGAMVSNYFSANNRSMTKYRFADVNGALMDAVENGTPLTDPVSGNKVSVPPGENNRALYKKLFNYALSPNTDMQEIRKFNFFWALGGNFSTAALQLFTLPIQTAGVMTTYSGNILGNNAAIARAMSLATKVILSKDGIHKLNNYEYVLKTVAKNDLKLADAIYTAHRMGAFTPARTQDMLGGDAFTSGKLVSAPGTITANAKVGLGILGDAAAAPIKSMEEVSRLGAFIAYYNSLRQDKNDTALASLERNYLKDDYHNWTVFNRAASTELRDPAARAAKFLLQDTHAVLGKLGRGPNQMGVFGALLFPFMQHPLMMMELMVRLWKSSPEGKMAASYMIGATFMLAGMFAIPGWELWKTLMESGIELTTGEKKELNYEFAKWANTHIGMSPEFAEFLTKGGIQALGGPAMAQRIGLPLIGGDHLARFINGSAAPEEFLGVAGSVLKGLKTNLEQSSPEELPIKMAETMAPVALKNLIKAAYTYPTEGARTNRGVQLMTPQEITPMMIAQKALGFQPGQIAREQEKRWVEKLGETGYRTRYNKYTTQIARLEHARKNAMDSGDTSKVNELTQKIGEEYAGVARFGTRVGIYDRQFMRDVREAVNKKLENMYFPDKPRKKVQALEGEREFLSLLYKD